MENKIRVKSVTNILRPPGSTDTVMNEKFNLNSTIITSRSPELAYDIKKTTYPKATGRYLKTIINAIKFLNRCDVDGATLVVICTEWREEDTNYVCRLYPRITAIDIWVDKFSNQHYPQHDLPSKVKYMYGHPTNSTYYNISKVLLICNLRCSAIKEEIPLHQNMLDYIKPVSACLKLRPIFPKDGSNKSLTFYSGECHTVCFDKLSSLELRVYIDKINGYRQCEYDLRKYESKLFHYNVKTRSAIYDDVSFDVMYYKTILEQYKSKYGTNDCIEKLMRDRVCDPQYN